jgi:hypothetical protein
MEMPTVKASLGPVSIDLRRSASSNDGPPLRLPQRAHASTHRVGWPRTRGIGGRCIKQPPLAPACDLG